ALNTLSPPGFREYFEYGAGIFRGSQRLVKMTKEYTQRLKDARYEAEGRFQNALRKNYSHISATYATEHDNAVDLIEKK
ncbi:MAG: hypothetical protein J6S53_03140, partial [Lentisphaeria bacterium]|nr:hypothetical protein [Lentisphaeria bacterium]